MRSAYVLHEDAEEETSTGPGMIDFSAQMCKVGWSIVEVMSVLRNGRCGSCCDH